VGRGAGLGELWWPLSSLACATQDGGLYVFLDEAQRVFARTSKAPVGTEPYVLTTNIRNTKKIAQVFGSLMQDRAQYRGSTGPGEVRPMRSADAVERADAAVDALLDEWARGRSPCSRPTTSPVHAQAIEHRGQMGYWDDFFAEEDVFYGHVLGSRAGAASRRTRRRRFREPDRAKRCCTSGCRGRAPSSSSWGPGAAQEVGGEGVAKRLAAADQWQP